MRTHLPTRIYTHIYINIYIFIYISMHRTNKNKRWSAIEIPYYYNAVSVNRLSADAIRRLWRTYTYIYVSISFLRPINIFDPYIIYTRARGMQDRIYRGVGWRGGEGNIYIKKIWNK